ncbi:DUF6266 family protein [Pedobacter alluvionis]|uniref:Uncharacterized protein n=1 Tax=Pedobacter alluvionis TaxID=475253 RepID=A0A497XS15_9SPHI|nr:DUF6266 family protein [Pedobacter alluvionis]RLJ69588.1 hypothetical protein BCL90_5186 [Pedobacter alluvionis]TFB28351.1 hypothetical protein E3V97_22985 [Pedobacter alluvionis]
MATYSKGANGAFSGKVGSVIGSNWRSIDYLRGLPKKSSKPSTEPQLAQRAKFALAALYLSPIKDILNIGFKDKQLNKITGYNAAVKIFLNQAVGGSYPDFAIDFSQVVMSRGSLSVFHGLNASLQGADLVLNWQSILNRYNSFTDDSLTVVLFNATKSMYLVYEDAQRAALTYTAVIGAGFSGDVFHGWAFAVKRDAMAVANSQYLGTYTIP